MSSLALFFSANAAAEQRAVSALSARWENYVVAELHAAAGISTKNDFNRPRASMLAQALADAMRTELRATFKLRDGDALNVQTSLRSGFASTNSGAFAGLGLLSADRGFATRQEFAPSVSHAFESGATLSLGGVFVYETFTANNLGASALSERGVDRSSGSGLTANWNSPIGADWRVSFGAQSRIKMDAYQNYTNIYALPGRFDLPERVSASLSWTPRFGELTGQVERVNYSKVAPFTSADLPDAFLSLLGDSASPRFAWDDLDVYSLRYEFQPSPRDRLGLTWASSQLPSPTSRVLAAVLDNDSDKNFALSYARLFGPAAKLRFAASYAPISYFVGPALLAEREYSASPKLEAEARFEVSF